MGSVNRHRGLHLKSKQSSVKKAAALERALRGVRALVPTVRTVADADKDVTTHVSDENVSMASLKAHRSCALAQACKQKKGVDAAIISRSTAFLVHGTHATRYLLSTPAMKEIMAFDRGGSFSPGDYTLKVPAKSQRLGAYRSSNKHGKDDGKRGKKRRYVFTRGIRQSLVGGAK